MDIESINLLKKKEFLCFLLSIILTVIILLFINYIISIIYKPNIEEIIQQATSDLIVKNYFAPEPVERLQYIISVLFSPILLVITYISTDKFFRKNWISKKINDLYLFGALEITIFILPILCFLNIRSNYIYLLNTILFKNFYTFIFFFFPIITFFVFYAETKPKFNKIFLLIYSLISSIFIIMLFFMGIFNKNQYYGNIIHFDAVFYSVSQVFGGKILLVDFINQYGLYPQFLNPFFQLVDLTVLNFSIIMNLLIVISFTFICFFIKRNVSNNVISLLGFSSIVFFSILMPRMIVYDVYFQYFPIRFFFPASFLLLASYYIEEKNKKIYYSISVLSSIALLWNFETGIVIIISWLLLLLYCESFHKDLRNIIKDYSHHLVAFFCTFCITIGVYSIYIYILSGMLPNFLLFTNYQQLFYISGYMMLRMDLLDPWNILIIIYLCGLLYSLISLIKNQESNTSKIIFLLSVLGFGLFSYYQGRSHYLNLFPVAYPSLLLLTIFSDNILLNIKRYGMSLYHNLILIILLIFILSISICSIGYHFNQYYDYSERGFFALNDTQDTIISENINFIKNFTKPGEQILILSNYSSGLYYGESKTVSILNTPGFAEIVTIQDYNSYETFLLNNSDIKVFIDLSNKNQRFDDIINQYYNIDFFSNSGQMVLVSKDLNKSNNNLNYSFIIKYDSNLNITN